MPQLIEPATGKLRDVSDQDVAGALAAGWTTETPADVGRLSTDAANELNYGGVGGGVNAALAGLARGASLGGSDVAARVFGGEDAAKTLEGLQAQNPYTSGASEFAGMLLPSVVTGGAATPAGIASIVGRRTAAGLTRAGAGVLERAAGHAAGAAVEGALYGGGQYLTDTALENKPLSAEGFVGGMGKGALFAAPVGGAFALAGEGLQRARALFPRSEITAEAAASVKNDASAALHESLADGDAMAASARQKIALADAQAGQAGARTQVTRTVFGGSDPAAMGAQVDATANKAQLAEALGKLETSQAALKDWIAAGGEDELADQVAGLQPPTALPPEAQSVPVGEFGEPGQRGIKSPEELQRAVEEAGTPDASPSAAPTEPSPATAVLRKGSSPPLLDAIGATPAEVSPASPAPASLDDIQPSPASRTPAESTRVGRRSASEPPAAQSPEPSPPNVQQRIEVVRVGRPTAGTMEARLPDGSVVPLAKGEARDWIESQLPKGYSSGLLETHYDFSIERSLPSAASEVKKNALYVVTPSEIADHGVMGNEIHPEHEASMAARSLDKRLPPIDARMTPDGRLWIEDGNHRLQQAAKTDAPVVVHIRPVGSDWEPQARARDISGRLRGDRGTTPVRAAPVDDARRRAIAGMSEEQLNKLQDDLNEQFKHVKPGDPDHAALSDLMDQVQDAQRPLFERKFAAEPAAADEANATGRDMVAFHRSLSASEKATGKPIAALEAPASVFKDAGYYEPAFGREDLKGKRRPILATVSPSGKIIIEEGRARLAAAIESGAPVKVKWRTGGEPGADDVLRHGPGVTAAPGGEVERVGAKPPAGPEPIAQGRKIADLKHADETAENFVLRRMREQGVSPFPGEATPKRFLGTLGIDWTVPENRALMLKMLRSGDAVFSRADLVAAMDPALVKSSEVSHMGADFHFIHDTGQPVRMLPEERAPAARAHDTAARPGSAANEDLEALLRGTQDKLAAGEPLSAIGAPARAEYGAAKEARTAAASEHFRGKAIAENHAGSGMAAAERAAKDEAVAQRSGIGGRGQRYTVAPKTAADAQLSDLIAGGHPSLPESHEELGKMFGIDLAPAETAGVKEPVGNASDLKSLLSQWSDENTGTVVDRSMRVRMGPIADDAAIEKLLQKRTGKNVDMAPALQRAAQVIGDHEAASAEAAGLLGSDAPKTAVGRAQALQAARAAQADAQGASSAKAAQGIQDRAMPALADKTAVTDDVARALQKHESAVEGAKDRALVSMQRAESKAAAAAPAPQAARATRDIGGKLADVGTALEVMKAMGVHVPVLSAIPVIGPVLGLFFKARAVLSILGRKGGSVGRSTEGLIAATSAATRDRLAAATQAILTGAGKGALKLSEVSAGPAVTLGYKLFPGPGITKSKDPQKLYEARMDEIARAQQPGAIDHAISDRYQTADPNLHDAIVAQTQRGIAFLDSKAPKPSILQSVIPGDGVWRPSKAQLDEWGKYVHAVGDPASVLEDLAKGHVTLEGAETLRVVYPELFAEGQRLLMQAAPQMRKTLPYPTRVAISILYRIPVDGSMAPGHLQYLQAGAVGGGAGPAPGAGGPPGAGAPPPPSSLTGPIKLGQSTMTSLDRRAGS